MTGWKKDRKFKFSNTIWYKLAKNRAYFANDLQDFLRNNGAMDIVRALNEYYEFVQNEGLPYYEEETFK